MKRIQSIDGIRGFSLFGILIANLLIFQYGIYGKDEINHFSISAIDQFFYGFTKIFVEESFMPIFAFLFGYSMIKMKDSLERKTEKVKRYFARRFLFLVVVGFLHSYFLWDGDILLFYGMMGFFLLLFLKRKKKTILVWGIVMFSTMLLLVGLGSFMGGEEPEIIPADRLEAHIDKSIDVLSSGSYWEIADFRNNEDPLIDDPITIISALVLSPLFMAPLFLFGMYAAHTNRFADPVRERRWNRIWASLLIPVGVTLKAVYYFNSDAQLAATIGGPMLALGYIFLLAYLYSKISFLPFLRLFENIGKLSMSNYLLQTVICTTVFYGYGLGMFSKLGVTWGILLGIVIYGLQAIFSTMYLKHFRYGPIEKISRIWTYFTWKGHIRVNIPERKSA